MEQYNKSPKDLIDVVGLSLRSIHSILAADAIFLGIKVRYRRTRGNTGSYQISDLSYQKLKNYQRRAND